MANIKISELNEIIKKSYDDVIPIVDVSANETKKISVEDLTANGVELIAVVDTAPTECSTGDKYYNTTTNKIYTATGEDTWETIGEDPIEGIMYVVFDSQTAYAYNGTTLISVGGGSGDLIVVGTDEPTEDTKLQIESMDLDAQYEEIDDIYSTDEINTNKVWIDGKPIYRKVYTTYTLDTGTTNDNIILETDANKKLINSHGFIYVIDSSYNFKITIGTPDVGFGIVSTIIQNRDGTLFLNRTHGGYGTLSSIAIVIEYTKTTD